MCGTRIFLGLAVVLVAAHARPDGYGVKGGHFHKSAANAVASAHATAHADAGGVGIAQSSASATANANTSGYGGGTNKADATANASVDGGNIIGKVVTSEKANGNANVLDDSDDLRYTSDRDRHTEYKCINHEDGTDATNNRDSNAEHVTSDGDYEDSIKTGLVRDSHECEPEQGVKGHGGAHGRVDKSRCKESKPQGSQEFPRQHEDFDLTAHSQHSATIDGSYGVKTQKPGTTAGSHVSSPCTPGDSKCFGHNPSISNSQPNYEKHTDISAGSSSQAGIDGSWGGNIQKPGTIAGSHASSPCTPGDSKCFAQNPSISNSHPNYEKHTDLSAGSSSQAGNDGGWGGNIQKPGTIAGSHASSPCTPGDSKCFAQNPSISNSHPNYEKHTDLSAGSSSQAGNDGGWGGNIQKPGTIAGSHASSPCTPGDSKCFGHNPSISNSQPNYEKRTDLSAGSSSQAGINSGYGGNTQKPETIGGGHAQSACTPGDSKCFAQNPSISNSHPNYEKHTDLSAGSSSQAGNDGGWGGNIQKPGTIGEGHAPSACTPGDSKCFAQNPTISNSHPNYEKHTDLSAGSSSQAGNNGGWGGNTQKPGTIGGSHAPSPCAPGDSQCFGHKPPVSSPYPTYEKNPDLSAGSSSPAVIDGGYGGNSQKPGTFGGSYAPSPCAPGDSKCIVQKPSVPNSYPTYTTYPTSFDAGYGGQTTNGHHHGSANAVGHSASSGHKPETTNPFLNGQIHLSDIKNPSNSGGIPAGKPNPLNPFLNPHGQVHPPTGPNHTNNPSGNNGASFGATTQYPQGGSSGNYGLPQNGQKPSNPFFSHHAQVDSMSGVKHSGVSSGQQQINKFPNIDVHPVTNGSPNSGCYGSISCSPSQSSENLPVAPQYPHGSSSSGSGHQDEKPNSSNPFLTQHSHGDKSTDTKYPESGNQGNQYPNAGGNSPVDISPSTNCHGSTSCSPNKPSEGSLENPFLTNHGPKVGGNGISVSGHESTQFPGKQTGDSNPFLIDDELIKPHSKPETYGHSNLKPDSGVTNPLDDVKPEIIQACGSGISSASCNDHKGPGDNDFQNSVTAGHGIDTSTKRNNYGIKGHGSGVKGGSYHQGHPIRLEGNPGLGDAGHSGAEAKASAESTASASASAYSNAHASSSSHSEAAQSSASAKSEAHSSNGGYGSSNSWASSSASASAFASSDSSSYSQHGWTAPVIPQVPAQ